MFTLLKIFEPLSKSIALSEKCDVTKVLLSSVLDDKSLFFRAIHCMLYHHMMPPPGDCLDYRDECPESSPKVKLKELNGPLVDCCSTGTKLKGQKYTSNDLFSQRRVLSF